MTKSYRIKTAVNTTQEVDQTIRVNIDQDFDFLEILSLKLTQNDVYRRFCSDYGVIVGRVVANGGFGIPNARVSVFVPLDSIDASDPVISTLYPYTSPQDRNEDGYRYNLLPYEPSYEGHIPTGTFPSRDDVLNRKEVLEIYEKYYKYTVRTNDSGDYMIVGVPLGNQQIVVDVDLSDIGCFSLRPTDLIRMNRGVKSQFDGNQFRSSEDLASLPQIVNINRTVSVSPFWGLGEECDVGITRVDFDLRQLNINIEPTATFMGSIYSSSDDVYLNQKCKPSSEQGDLCSLVTGPGKVLAIRQTIELDENGLPILEQYQLPEGGKVIDDEGTFVVDVPMNLDYVITNEYGELVLSNNPNVGIPTRGKYRFKVKYSDTEKDIATIPSPLNIINSNLFNLSSFKPKGSLIRGNYLIPNIKEYGWTNSDTDPVSFAPSPFFTPTILRVFGSTDEEEIQSFVVSQNTTLAIQSIDEYQSIEIYVNNERNTSKWIEVKNGGTVTVKIRKKTKTEVSNGNTVISYIPVNLTFNVYNYYYIQFQKSYSFSLDWSDYANIQDALDCSDIFYEFTYNKVYTTAQLIDEFRYSGDSRGNFLSIKEVLDRSCSSTVNRPPINDGVRNFDIIYFISSIFLFLFSITGPIFIITYSITKYLWNNFAVFIIGLLIVLFGYLATQEIIAGVAAITGSVLSFGATALLAAPFFAKALLYIGAGISLGLLARTLSKFKFPSFSLPMITYPDCSACDCGDNDFGIETSSGDANVSTLADVNLPGLYTLNPDANGDNIVELKKNLGWGQVVAGSESDDETDFARVPRYYQNNENGAYSLQLPIPERINLYNTKGHYFNTTAGGGTNRIKVYPNYTGNTSTTFYEDMPYVFLADAGTQSLFTTGQLLSFVNPALTSDVNINITGDTKNQFNTTSVTGTTITTNQITINYADPNNPATNIPVNVNIVNNYTGETSYLFASDIEYHQVVTAITVGDLITLFTNNETAGNKLSNPSFLSSFYRRILFGEINMVYNFTDEDNDEKKGATYNEGNPSRNRFPLKTFDGYENLLVVILMRGIDPYTNRQKTKIDVSLPFGLKPNSVVVESNYKLNIPIQTNLSLPRHNDLTTNNTTSFGTSLFYPSYIFTPSTSVTNELYTYSGYSTNNHLYYSSFDISTDTCDYGYTTPSNNDYYVLQNTPGGGSCFGGRNTMVGRYTSNNTDGNVDSINNLDTYYINEYVGGGAIMYRSTGNGFLYKRAVYDVTGSTKTLMSNNTKIIMRSERLPRSDSFDNNFVFAQNKTFAVYTVSDNGLGTQIQGSVTETLDYSTGQAGDFQETYGTGTTSVMGTFTCESITPLAAYEPQSDGQQLSIKPKTDPVYYKDGDTEYPKVKNGCYVLCSKDLQIGEDLALFAEWKARFSLGFAICRNVFGLTFTNQWINGSLYMPGFQNDKIYDGIEITNPSYNYCKRKIVYRIENNSFFYRSSPYNENVGFIGMKSNNVIGNKYFLGSPTTVVDLGPKDNIIKNICAKPEFQGYYLNRLQGSTYNSPGDLLQLFVVSRLTNSSFLQNLFSAGSSSVGEFFTRQGQKIDGDFAQLVSINSELGVTPFSPDVYNNDNLFFGKSEEPIMGVFFTADTITRDFVSPGRTTYIDTTKKFGYNTFGVKTQTVPMYQWAWVAGQGKPNVFGSQNNTWYTEKSTGGVFYSIGYQNIDRLNDDTYFPSQIKRPTNQRPGYIYNSKPLFDGSNNITGFTYDAFLDSSFAIPSFDPIDVNQDLRKGFVVGAPYHFYFGIRKGKTAFDKFVTNNLIE